MIIQLIYTILLLFFLYKLFYKDEKYKMLEKIPLPRSSKFLLGNTMDFLTTQVPLFYRVRRFNNSFDGICRMKFPGVNVVFLSNPDDIEVLLTSQKNITKEKAYELLHPWLGTGLLTSTGEKWQNRRKILTPAFHFNILKQFCKVFNEHSQILVDDLMKSKDQEVNILPFIIDFTLNSICETAMGTTIDSSKNAPVDYKKAIYTLGELFLYQAVRPWIHSPLLFNLVPKGMERNKTLKTLHGFTNRVIDERRKIRAEFGDKFAVDDYVDDKSKKKRSAMLDLLLQAESENKIDTAGIREEVDTFMFEGHDTTTVGITFTLLLLANNPEAQQLAYEEVQSVLGDDLETIGIDSLNDLRYLERCIKESLRLYPSVPAFGRELVEDLKLKNYTIPAKTEVEIYIYDMHRNYKIYPNPNKFDPDRFLPENCAKRHNFAYLPFSAGPRNCIGQKFAMLQLKTVISIILRKFKLEAITKPDDIIFYTDIVLRSETPIKIKFIPRTL